MEVAVGASLDPSQDALAPLGFEEVRVAALRPEVLLDVDALAHRALYLGLEKVTHGNNSRRALLLITDGMDNHSRYKLNDVRQFAKEHDVMIYSIGIVSEADQMNGYNGGPILESLASLTGGVAYFAGSIESLPGICAQIGADLKNKYLLGYRSSNLASDGKWRKIRVRLNRPSRPQMQVRSKNGYYAATLRKVMN